MLVVSTVSTLTALAAQPLDFDVVVVPEPGTLALGLFGLIEMVIFIVILLVGYVYAWKKGALEWE